VATTAISFVRDIEPLVLPTFLFVAVAYLFIAGFSNAVNLTDGLDGLAAGCSAMVFASYVIISFWQFGHDCGTALVDGCYTVRDPLDVTLIAAAAMGACLGFLWWNTSPARIFMGDTGSLALGGLMSGLAVVTRTELLLVVLGGLFVAVTLSVVIQVAFFRATRRRVFRMAPLHHHFELAGWTENTVIVRFWLVTGMAVAFGIGLFYADWLSFAGL
jgi:phospho-N-acetylmuramoyl-pentapeptide-transferase